MLTAYRHLFLRGLPPDHELLEKLGTEVLPGNKLLYKPGDVLDRLYFVESGLVGILRRDRKRAVQVWCHGSGGRSFVGAWGLFIPRHVAGSEYRVIVPGMARVLSREAMKGLTDADSGLEALMGKIANVMHSALEQMMFCHSWHSVEERIATQLLLVRYALGTDRIPISRQKLADMVGCTREATYSVDEKWASIVTIKGGIIHILDALALHGAACGCFDALVRDRDTMVGPSK